MTISKLGNLGSSQRYINHTLSTIQPLFDRFEGHPQLTLLEAGRKIATRSFGYPAHYVRYASQIASDGIRNIYRCQQVEYVIHKG
jgi:hypothetical protein